MARPDFKEMCVSQEYFAADWSKFFLGWLNLAYRAAFDDSETKIDHPGILIDLMIDNKSRVLDHVSNILNNGGLIQISKLVIDGMRGKHSARYTSQDVKNTQNLYRTLIINYKDVDYNDLARYQKEFELYKGVIQYIKNNVCKTIPKRKMSTSEISDLKLLKPDKAKRECAVAISYFKDQNEEFGIFVENFVKWFSENVIKYLADNIIKDD